MTETPEQPTTEDVEAQQLLAAAAAATPGGEATDAADGHTEPHSPNREAAGYRHRLREVEAERDQLTTRLDAAHARAASQIAAGRLADPDDLWHAADLASLRTDDGDLDPDKVDAAVDELVRAKPHYRKPAPNLMQGPRGGSAPEHRLGAIFNG